MTSYDELQDLSPADAEELRAFLDKRKWFEAKLEVLEASTPIYPFVHPNLNGSAGKFGGGLDSTVQYQLSDDAQYRLPSVAETRAWQLERDGLEEEVLAFDGGDLGRMKQKTREVTLLPLTKPSTHLVSITLALIVLIDKLLTQLRRRGELLELTQMRLRWDQIRWDIIQEIARVRKEIKRISQTQQWKPAIMRSDKKRDSTAPRTSLNGSTSRRPDSPHTRSSTTPLSSSQSRLSFGSISSILADDPQTSSPSTVTPSRDHQRATSVALCDIASPAKMSLQLPLLQSHISNIETRCSGLSTNAVTRCGRTLDKMIDIAGHLQDLGDVNGQVNESRKSESGAVPDELLDLQDELEEDVKVTEEGLQWCKTLAEQWKDADAHYAACMQVKSSTQALLSQLQSSKYLINEDQCDKFRADLEAIREEVPGDPKEEIPYSSVPALDLPDHSGSTVQILERTRKEVLDHINLCQLAIDWSRRLAQSMGALNNVEKELSSCDSSYGSLRNAMEIQPDLRSEGALHMHLEEWQRQLASIRKESDILETSVKSLRQQITIAIMQHRQLVRDVPPELEVEVDHHLAAPEILEDLVDKVDCSQDMFCTQLKEAETDLLILEPAQGTWQAISRVEHDLEDLTSILKVYHRNADYDGDRIKNIDQQFKLTRSVFSDSVDRALGMLKSHMTASDIRRPELISHIDNAVHNVDYKRAYLQQAVETGKLLSSQLGSVRKIEEEAKNHIADIGNLVARTTNGDAEHSTQQNDHEGRFANQMDTLVQDIQAWNSSLNNRMVAVCKTGHEEQLTGVHTDASPEGSTITGLMPDDKALAVRDVEARLRINEASARVLSALDEAKATRPQHSQALPEKKAIHAVQSDDVFGPISAKRKDEAGAPSRFDHVWQASGECDIAFSHLIDVIDADPVGTDTLQNAENAASRSVSYLHAVSQPYADDRAVKKAVRKTDATWKELQTMVQDIRNPGSADKMDDDISEISSIAPSSRTISRSVSTVSLSQPMSVRTSSRSSSRVPSAPIMRNANYLSPTKSSTARSVSETLQKPASSASRIPRPRTISNSSRMSTNTSRTSLSSIISSPANSTIDLTSPILQRSRLPSFTPSTTDTTPKARRTPRLSSQKSGTRPSRKPYIPDPKSKIDVAVGKVVNKMNINVAIQPVGLNSDEWKDQSGKYWIGAEGRAKLCFCRILRSKTVMVRVGGGWVELSKFLLEHFAEAFGPTVPTPTGAGGVGSLTPIPITSASLKTPARRSLSSSSFGSRSTSRQTSLTGLPHSCIPEDGLSNVTPKRDGENPDLSPISNGPGSPLYPLHFMRKASESPPVREKQKEMLRTGKRSILGRASID